MSAHGFLHLLLKGVGWFLLARVGSALSLLVINVLLARVLSIQEFAAFVLFLSIVTVVGTVAGVGLGTACMRAVAEARALQRWGVMRRTALIGFLVSAALGLGLATLTFVWPVPLLLEEVLGRPMSWLESACLIVWLVGFAVRITGGYVYRGLQLLALAAFYQGTAGNVLAAILLLTAVAGGLHGLATPLLVMATASVLPILACWGDIARRLRKLPAATDATRVELRPLLRAGGFLSVSTLFQTNGREICVWVVSAVAALPEVALFGVANRLMQVIELPVVVLNQALQPFIAEFRARGDLAAKAKALRLTTTLLFPVMAGLVVGILLLGETLLGLVFGPEFLAAKAILLWLALGRLIQAFFGPTMAVLSMTGHERMMARDSFLQCLGLVLLGAVLGWLLGAVGVAVAFCVTLATVSVYRMLTVRRRLGLWLLPELDPAPVLELARTLRRRRHQPPPGAPGLSTVDGEKLS